MVVQILCVIARFTASFIVKIQPESISFIRKCTIKPTVISAILIAIAIYDYLHTLNVIRFLIVMDAARGSLSLSWAIELLQRYVTPMKLSPPPGKTAADEQDERA